MTTRVPLWTTLVRPMPVTTVPGFLHPVSLYGKSIIPRATINFAVRPLFVWILASLANHATCAPAEDFIRKIDGPQFDSTEALDMLHRLYTMDYGRRHSGARPLTDDDQIHPLFFLDFISIIGRPGRSITRPSDRFFDNVTISFQHWRAPYSSKHHHCLPFDLAHRTFRLAAAATRETWFIVMHPIVAHPPASSTSSPLGRQQREQSAARSALRVPHAEMLAGYIKGLFLAGDLLGEGVEPAWVLDGTASQVITSNKWSLFQDRFMSQWPQYVQQHSYDSFWRENTPAFHAYDYGANIEIPVTERLQSLPAETRLRPTDDDEEEDGVFRHGDEGEPLDGTPPDDLENYPDGLRQLLEELEQKYQLDHIDTISYALAVDLHCVDGSHDGAGDSDSLPPACCLLGDRNLVIREYQKPGDVDFYPLAFHPAFGNYTSAQPPAFLAGRLLAILRDNMSFQNDGADVLSCGYFQMYSNIKRSIRHSPNDLLVTKGTATAALALSTEDAHYPAPILKKQQRLLQRLEGGLSPENPEASKPYARERQRIEQAIHEEEYAYRMEQVLSVQVALLVPAWRRFRTILRPIFQLMRFYLQERQQYTHILRAFPSRIFPQVLASFARLFELAAEDIQRRFHARGTKGLGVALAEGIAALDRLGSYCFTGARPALMPSIMRPLGTVDAIRNGAWPYLAPRMLDLRNFDGTLNLVQWPRRSNGRPILMHLASLAFHYGGVIAAERESLLWFRDFGGSTIHGPRGATTFLEDVFRDLWIPQMTAFIRQQLHRQLTPSSADAASRTSTRLATLQQQREMVQTWSQSTEPFSWKYGSPTLFSCITLSR
jgi:hypothetical protein